MDTTKEGQQLIKIDSDLSTPIYRQIVESIQQAIADGHLQQGALIPSVNAIAAQFSIARGSIFKAYNELRTAGIIDSIPGKGYFVINTRQTSKRNIFLLMSTYNPYREIFYSAFTSKLKNHALVDIYFHHHNIEVFETLIQNHTSHYNTFVIMPEIHKRTESVLKRLDQRNLFILDTGLKEFGKRYPGVCQNYEKDIYAFLESVAGKLLRYRRIFLLFSGNMRNYDVIKGFERFFKLSKFKAQVIRNTATFEPNLGDLCLVMDDNDLVRLVLYAKEKGWELGQELGVISYHETPLKSIVADGITTISPDFHQMGISIAEMILQNQREHIENPFLMTARKSF
ncbi:GntR family transcriptional regulator [Parapedobacter tibetensis]|uniref:GntR family transcriptional regulator n=1 Tax=Parapedobacter tibetensis TaxID=2972951 RepID=UPI00214DE007|nr:GntR family transcriptional regulator [Parapedobacter tibetensis]